MIQWKEYDKDNKPEIGKTFIVYSNSDGLTTAELLLWTNGQYGWTRNDERTLIRGVTHYAPIDLPLKE
jgi:hypothetical protein